jgi:hypothetical protein
MNQEENLKVSQKKKKQNFFFLISEKYKIMSWKYKTFEDLEDFFVFIRLYFIIARYRSYVPLSCTIFYNTYICY